MVKSLTTGVVVAMCVWLAIVALVLVLAWYFNPGRRSRAAKKRIESARRAHPSAGAAESGPRDKRVESAAPIARHRSAHGPTLDEAKRLGDDPETSGLWLFVDDRRVDANPLGDEPVGYYVRVTRDPGEPGGYLVERLTAEEFVNRRPGLLQIDLFFVSRLGHVGQGTSNVIIAPVGRDLRRPVPLPCEARNRPITRFPMTGRTAQNELNRLAGLLSRATRLESAEEEFVE